MVKETHIKFYPYMLPFKLLYGAVIWIRNLLFDWRLMRSQQYTIPVICIGNLAVGGTGKTPLVDYLVRMLSDKYRVAVLSRGYKRKSSGYKLANEQSTSRDIGDEACQLKQKYPHVTVAVDKKRRRGIKHLLDLPEDVRPQIILLDDGFQHRYLQPSFSILITAYNRLYYLDKLLPVGLLRETAKSISRADMVLISKCPAGISRMDCRLIENEINPAPNQHIFFTNVLYQQLKGVFPKDCFPSKLEYIQKDDEILLITGIANPAPFVEEIKTYSDKVSVMSYGDHHEFRKKDFARMQSTLLKMTGKRPMIICSEKDAARLRHNPYLPEDWKSHLYYLPMQVHFMFNRNEQFDNLIMKHITLMESGKILMVNG